MPDKVYMGQTTMKKLMHLKVLFNWFATAVIMQYNVGSFIKKYYVYYTILK